MKGGQDLVRGFALSCVLCQFVCHWGICHGTLLVIGAQRIKFVESSHVEYGNVRL